VTGEMRYPAVHQTAPEGALADYLAEAEQLLRAHEDCPRDDADASVRVSADFEHLRWFELPASSVGSVCRTE